MVMGVQRSGTTAIFTSLAADKSLTAYDEDIDNAVYTRFRLRPLCDIAHLFDTAPGTVLLKPICETFDRTLLDLRTEYSHYNVRFVWIYRDPVNVLHSMHREGWISAGDIASERHIAAWRTRNEYALQFQADSPQQIAIVRYEDLSRDPKVFRQLSKWLEVRGKCLLRPDISKGRKVLPPSVQQSIDVATATTMDALDAARAFTPRRIFRWQAFVPRILEQRFQSSSNEASRAPGDFEFQPRRSLSDNPLEPSAVERLSFWLDASIFSPVAGGEAAALVDQSPRRITSSCPANGPYHVSRLRGKGTLVYPHAKARRRERDASGITVFGTAEDWRFIAEGWSFTLIALFRPNLPPGQRCAKLLCIRVSNRNESFVLQWARDQNDTTAFLHLDLGKESNHTIAASGGAGTHPHQEWRIATVCYGSEAGSDLVTFIEDKAGPPAVRNYDVALPLREPAGTGLQLGGCESEHETFFYGEIAEIIIFEKALGKRERLSIIQHLKDKYCL